MGALQDFVGRVKGLAAEYKSGNFSDIGKMNIVAVAGEHAIAKIEEMDAEVGQLLLADPLLLRLMWLIRDGYLLTGDEPDAFTTDLDVYLAKYHPDESQRDERPPHPP